MNQIIEEISGLAGPIVGIFSAKEDEGNWGACKLCGCGKCNWDADSCGKLLSVRLNNICAYKICCCGHHFTQHKVNNINIK